METQKNFKLIFWFLVGTTAAAFIYLFMITFIKIPKGNERFADTGLGFLLGTVIGGAFAYLVTGTPPKSNKPDTQINVNQPTNGAS